LVRWFSSGRMGVLDYPVSVLDYPVFPGRDGLIRSVEVKTSRGVLVRPIQRLHDLEINDGFGPGDHPTSESSEDLAVRGMVAGLGPLINLIFDNSG